MTRLTRRYLFAFFDDLSPLGVRQYDLVCDRLFILVPEKAQAMPIDLAVSLQRLGKGTKWIRTAAETPQEANLLLAFILGRMHEKVPVDIEFALLFDSDAFDPLLGFIRAKGRACQRITSRSEAPPVTLQPEVRPKLSVQEIIREADIKTATGTDSMPSVLHLSHPMENDLPPGDENGLIRERANKVTEWLKRSGNRPAEVALLKQYITLNNPEMKPATADNIIFYMATTNEIEIRDKGVVYNF